MLSFPHVNTLTWADKFFKKLRPETGQWIWKTPYALGKYFVATFSYFMGELTPQLFFTYIFFTYLPNYLPNYFSLFLL